MHPAPSVILFTVLSGLGFGLLVFLGIGEPEVTGWTAFWFFLIAYALAVGGLVASTFHLGHPERALKAFSQWRSSWLSREAWAAVAALVVMGLHAAAAVFLGVTFTPLGWLGAALSLATVLATAMIYTQIRAVPRWNQVLTPLHLVSASLAGGALLAGQITPASVLLLVAGLIQVGHWKVGDARFAEVGQSLASATGLGAPGRIRAFAPPHTGTNYLLREMVHRVGRKHARKLRALALTFGYALPLGLILVPGAGHLLGGLAVLSHVAGMLASRWLFFAEAEHVVGLYYGARG
ncbi:dimethyl sulfoxide reductase anchor subunit family protein [Roseicyclus persicicus]|uniref:Dimethyl sulfoxide reductase anchor subunit n=1 Tax=Roseicyclus persicicus TaxID=2650661 RepID=A0A7X6GVQ2_9RHOB|nr:DmsC/YnfH family molybdoenzyme membrane anchor subunit [Roseibacterium persicicum]NKX43246.1 dimethyl sulfoxide reductase anchor subunit [Roseibacterium persicicum]